MGKILTPFKPSLTITIDIDESNGQMKMAPSKPVDPTVMFATLQGALNGVYHQTMKETEARVIAKSAKGIINGK